MEITTRVPSFRSSFDGQVMYCFSCQTSFRNFQSFLNISVLPSCAGFVNSAPGLDSTTFNVPADMHPLKTASHKKKGCWQRFLFVKTGRTGRNRTRNPRFWRPVLCQLSYCPALYKFLPCLLMIRVFPAVRTELLQFESVRMITTIFGRCVITILALFTSKDNYFSHDIPYSKISPTTPAPMVRPPSRIAKRRPCSIAIGVISSTLTSTWSPGITISTPSGRVREPVTSVVRK